MRVFPKFMFWFIQKVNDIKEEIISFSTHATQFKCAKLSVFDGICIWCKVWSKIGDRLTTHKYFCFTQKFISHGRQILKPSCWRQMLLSHKYLLYLYVYKCNLSKQTFMQISLTFMTHFRPISVMMVKNKIQTMMMQ